MESCHAGEAANGSAANGTGKAAEARLPPCADPITRLKELVRGLPPPAWTEHGTAPKQRGVRQLAYYVSVQLALSHELCMRWQLQGTARACHAWANPPNSPLL